MDSFHLKIRAAYVGACLPAVSTEATRYYLNGVCFESAPNNMGVNCIATDGHRLIISNDPSGTISGYDPDPESKSGPILSIPKDATKYLRDAKGAERYLEIQGKNAVITEVYNDIPLYQWQPHFIDGTFPDWRRVIPDMTGAEPSWSAFNTKYLGEFSKVFSAFAHPVGSLMVIAKETRGPAIVKFGMTENVLGVIMPMRSDIDHSIPHWIGK